MFENYFELGGISKNPSSIFRGFTLHHSIFLTTISKYFCFAKELALYQNDTYVRSNENALIFMDAAHKTIEIGEETQCSWHIKGSDKGIASDKRCNIYNPNLDTNYNAFCAKKTCTLFRLYRGQVD